MPTSPIQLVVFDLGGVMIRLAGGWEGACREAGVPFRPFAVSPERKTRFEELEEGISSGALTPEQYYAGLHDAVEGVYSPRELEAIYMGVICEEFPGICDLVQQLKSLGLRTACLSNTCGPHWTELTNPQRYPGICALDTQHASHLLAAAKPDPVIYQRFTEAVGAIPAHTLFFDDNLRNVHGAIACGWHAVHITAERPSVEQIREGLATHGVHISCPL